MNIQTGLYNSWRYLHFLPCYIIMYIYVFFFFYIMMAVVNLYHLLSILKNTHKEMWWHHRRNVCLPRDPGFRSGGNSWWYLNLCLLESGYLHLLLLYEDYLSLTGLSLFHLEAQINILTLDSQRWGNVVYIYRFMGYQSYKSPSCIWQSLTLYVIDDCTV